VAVADTLRLDGCAHVTSELLSSPETFAEGVLEPLVLTLLGYHRVRNYDGSFREWGNRDDTPIVSGP